MSTELQQARIQMSGLDGGINKVTQDKLRHIRKEIRNSNELDNLLESEQAILDTFLVWRK